MNKLILALFPNSCPLCRRAVDESVLICDNCMARLPGEYYCVRTRCGHDCVAALPYTKNYAKAVKYFKFRKRAFYAPALGKLLYEAARRQYDFSCFDFVTCVPMHPKAQKKRRYNQSELLAMEVSALSGVPYLPTLEKTRKHKPQHKKAGFERFKGVIDLFRLRDDAEVQGKRILLIDDVVTSGSTLDECANVLIRGGCKSVCCAAVCAARRRNIKRTVKF